ncbi:NLR family CARD domain-containing protein 3-like isoform X2 [Rhinichthys klamathensis goyatoka]|uniref:NLR family CARD domain-containing protein 3-like isoform X2 n=1 Tax=Rhinichthys klamathensis goyatoka TaxID=3034132 RepID=UPI0024B60DEB|nr:NLR family CARD domain-containing protein 3-like isoform X2 [Rhinichthys klamathensis goyatoka]
MNSEEDTDYHNTCDGEKRLMFFRSLERSVSHVPSVLSMKSDKSMKIPIQFKKGDSQFDQSSEERSHSSDPSVWSLKTDKPMKIPNHLKNGYSLYDQRHNGYRHNQQKRDPEIYQKLKSCMKKKHLYILEGFAKQGNPTLLNEIYTELYITEGGNGEISNEHEIKRIEKSLKAAEGATIPIKCNDIFRPLPGQDKPIRTVLTKGVAGIGKTVSVQKFILDWAEEKENQDVQLVFPLPFREINLMKDKKFSLVGLLQTFFMGETSLHLIQNSSVVFIFDGLDECRLPLNFHSNETLLDVTKETSLDALLTNLIVGNLLPSALIWITSRPAAADLVPSECVHRVTEVRGFNDPQKEEYFRKRISDQSLANTIITHLKSSRSLYIMCHIPVFCWISATVLEKMLSEAERGEIPKTLTQMYTHFLMAQISIKDTKYNEKNDTDREMIFKLGKLAFQQLVKGNVIFYEEDLRECGVDVTEASVYSGLCTQIFREEFGWYQGKVFCFVHLSVQEHLAALYVHLSFHNSSKNVLAEGNTNESEMNVTVPIILKCAVDKTLESKTGHLDLFLRFLMGLSIESNQALLERFFAKRTIIPQDSSETTEYLKDKLKICCPETSILLFHCLNELNDHSLNDEIQKYITLGKVEDIQSQELWFALMFILMTSDEKFDEFELYKYGRSDTIFGWLQPVIKLSTKARLDNCNITEKGCITLSILLSSQSNVRELNVSHNKLQDSGVEILSVGVKESCYARQIIDELFCNVPNKKDKSEDFISLTAGLQDTECRLESLNLKNCGVTEAGCVFLSSALSLNPSHLKVLDLSWNNIGDSGVKQLCAALEKVQCALETLKLSNCNVTHEGVTALTEALKSNPSHLKEIDLLENDLEESDLNAISMILEKSS